MTQTETLELLVATLQQANSSQSESIERLTRQNEQAQNKASGTAGSGSLVKSSVIRP